MKIDRLIAITVHLLNHQIVSATTLAERFEVSKRTIQRDIDTLTMAGIPIVSTHGANGGYEIIDGFKLQKHVAGVDDYQNIIIALQGLATASSPQSEQGVFIDLSVAREGIATGGYLQRIETAIQNKVPLKIEYTSAQQAVSTRIVEPLALTYRWYAWYLLAYCTAKKDYRLFKVTRLSACCPVPGCFSQEHGPVNELLRAQLSSDTRQYLDIKLLCGREVRQQVLEYLQGQIEAEHESGDFTYIMRLAENERMWFSLLLGFGNQVQVLEPEELRTRLKQKAQEILGIY